MRQVAQRGLRPAALVTTITFLQAMIELNVLLEAAGVTEHSFMAAG